MMINIIHGDDSQSSRDFLNKLDVNFQRYDSIDGSIDELRQLLDGNSLFDLSPNVLIENLFSRKAKNLEEIVALINKTASTVYLYDSKEMTPKNLKLFPKSKVDAFPLPKALFSFLDSIYPSNPASVSLFGKALEGSELEILVFMVIRQLRIMMALTIGADIEEAQRLQSWQREKLLKQATLFGTEKLKKAYNDLFEIDVAAKSGGLRLPLRETIDMWLLNL